MTLLFLFLGGVYFCMGWIWVKVMVHYSDNLFKVRRSRSWSTIVTTCSSKKVWGKGCRFSVGKGISSTDSQQGKGAEPR